MPSLMGTTHHNVSHRGSLADGLLRLVGTKQK